MRSKGWLEALVIAVTTAEPSYGYAIAAALRSAGVGDLADASLYPVLKKLEAQGFVTSDWDTTGGGPARKVYTATSTGVEHLRADVAEWRAVRDGIDCVFSAAITVVP